MGSHDDSAERLALLKESLGVIVPFLIEVERIPNQEHVSDGHNAAVKALRNYVKMEEE